ncbi:hypothetical protein GO495_19575 [Chitinophaga oryziterrae]|uniref:Cardiolipin synthase N-terminal domain-containing protein n=1 Tax=Chitinophaga oryziterrae TaxID=1031224 RepID=A0A6N8JCZ8_9BACT|nr:tetratricopeptide repeat protein [Chitinophaga oryziterrae]MVT42804.1 hypothetical protein [Chitinophaga oryziterrae]
MYAFWNNSYYLIILAQIFCVAHAMKKGKKDWIYIIIFLPAAGAIAYFIREILPEINRGEFTSNLQNLFLPNHNIKEWERRVRVADTVTNKLQLADAYAQQKQYAKAIALAESCRVGHHANDVGITQRLARLYFYNEQYGESIASFKKLLSSRKDQMNNQEDELLYAKALEGNMELERAEEEYKKVIRVHHSLEAMYYYGLMLKKQRRNKEAAAQFQAVRDEIELHPRYVRRMNTQWVRLSRKEMAGL